jgi:hypothetical protein
METTEPITPTTITKACELPECGKEFQPSDSRHKFCSNNCRAKANRLGLTSKRSLGDTQPSNETSQSGDMKLTAPKVSKEVMIPADLSSNASFIIETLKEQRNDWKAEWQDERRERISLMKEKERLEKELADLKHTKEIELLKNEKPGGLQGFAESPFMANLLQHIGPAIGQFAMNQVHKNGGAPGYAPQQNDPGLGEGISTYGQQFSAWMGTLPEAIQQNVWQLISVLIEIGNHDQEKLSYMVNGIIGNMQSYGSR